MANYRPPKGEPSPKYKALVEAKRKEQSAKANAAKAQKRANGLVARVKVKDVQVSRARKKVESAMSVQKHQVAMLVSQGWLRPQIAKFMGISEATLRRDYANELNFGDTQMNAKVSQNLYEIALDKNHKGVVTAAIFIAKTRMGWSERKTIDVNLPGNPQLNEARESVIDPRTLTAEQRETLRQILLNAIEDQAEREGEEFIEGHAYELGGPIEEGDEAEGD